MPLSLSLPLLLLSLLLTPATPLLNVLLFICDDLRPQLNASYGKREMHTPHLDAFAARALTFNRAYSNFGICSPSRNSFMSGRSPDSTRVWNFRQDFRMAGVSSSGRPGRSWAALPQHFKASGYLTLGHGKLYHPGKPPAWDEPASWSPLQPYGPEHVTGCPALENYCPSTLPAAQLSDRNTTTQAMATLARMAAWRAANSTPFFLGVGMHFPHQAWATEAGMADFYPAPPSLSSPQHPYSPLLSPGVAFTAELDGNDHLALNFSNPSLGNRTRDPSLPANATTLQSYPVPSPGNNTVPPFFAQYLRLGYYSAVTTSDAHFGMLMAALSASGQESSTIVAVLGDHGWQLGEHSLWGKHTNFDLSVHVPLLVHVPSAPASWGQHTDTVVELLDLYRTLSSLAGAPAPEADVEGKDFSPIFADPSQLLFTEAYSQYSRCPGKRNWPAVAPLPDWALNNCEDVPAPNITYMGYSVRTLHYRLTQWYPWDGSACVAQWGAVYARELYNHTAHTAPGDFDSTENENIAAGNPELVAQLEAKLLARFHTAGSGCPPDAPGVKD